ncbi:class I SAM-dependent methyltransferase [Pseudonocardia sp.]|uniref:class I SAM-dependent methyltransferase n=1 Tax=Pseudonocardia sp. TaxID=60912 RepID=UPI002612EF81|nr:class I SAM-dependent methyltransferase [Pseudonocardia sp.]
MDDERSRRSLSFGSVAAAYAAHRPGYPLAAVAWALEPLTGRAAPQLLDLAAGTGKLTAALLTRRGGSVTAVDPDRAMLAELRARHPTVRAVEGRAEAIPLPDASVDAVLVGQAWHWFDTGRAEAEIVRVLRPGGVLAVVRNDEDPDARLMNEFLDFDVLSAREGGHDHGLTPPSHEVLGPVEQRRFANPHRTDIDSTVARVGTFSWMLAARPAERAAFERRLRAYLASRSETSGAFTLPLVTTVLRALRR